jgi:hypothetical protein
MPKKGEDVNVKVVVRCRPMNRQETADGREHAVAMDLRMNQVTLRNPKDGREAPKVFTFDQIYDWNSKQEDVFANVAQPIIEQVIGGFNGTIFAYGQTGTGKTFTMEGVSDPPELQGILPRTFRWIFDACDKAKAEAAEGSNAEFLVRASYLEIYNEEIRDLLAKDHKKKLELKESVDQGVYVKDLSMFVLKSVSEIEHVFNVGSKNRSVGSTLMNADSSRSHSIFTLVVESSMIGIDGEPHLKMGKLHLVDLAGSERSSKTGASGARALEGIKINLSLTSLGNVISSLVDGKSQHIPYRDSKLTRMLQDSLGGNAKTVMVANMGPADYNYDETLSTLRYANRAKNIKNKPRINEDPKDAMLREFQDELARLREEAKNLGTGTKIVEERRKVGLEQEQVGPKKTWLVVPHVINDDDARAVPLATPWCPRRPAVLCEPMARRLMVAVSDRVCPQVDAELAREREQLERQKQQKLRARQDAARLAEQQAGELEAAQRKRAEMERQLAERQAETERMGGDVESIKRAAEENRIRRVGAPVAACRVCVARPRGLECGCPAERVVLPGANAHPRRRCGGVIQA